jgi:serine/threonine-protein kinase
MAFRHAKLADYQVEGALGSGATARVFAARHVRTGLAVAIKVLEPSARGSVELRTRLEREAHALAGVRSPHVARLISWGWEQEQPFLVLERLEGDTLADVLKRHGSVSVERLCDWVEQLLLGVRDIHAANVIHRDIKPANIFLVQHAGAVGAPLVKLIDFGVARLKEIAMQGASLTSNHHLIGSMGYMAPEQLEYAKGVGPPADLYAVGCVVFRCLTGRLPFLGTTFEALQTQKLEKAPPRISSLLPNLDVELVDAFVEKSLSRRVEERFASASEMLEAWWKVSAAVAAKAPSNRPPPAVEGRTEGRPRDTTIPDRSFATPVYVPASATARATAQAEQSALPEYDVFLEDTETVLELDEGGARPSVQLRRADASGPPPSATPGDSTTGG